MTTYMAIKWVDGWMLAGWIIHVCISHQSDLGFYQGPIKLRLVYMDRFYEYLFWVQGTAICFGLKSLLRFLIFM